jgi:vacuolar-type H+-ATPase subunit E/Vma4
MELFSKVVLDKVKKEYKDTLKELDQRHKELRDKKMNELEKQGISYAREMKQRALNEKKKIISRARGQARKNILVKKEELLLHLKGHIVEEINRYCETDQYKLFLSDRIKEYQVEMMMLRGEFIVICRSVDREIVQVALRNAGIDNAMTFVDDDEILGGLTLINRDKGIKINMTLDSVINENNVYIGALIHDLLEEAGELDE